MMLIRTGNRLYDTNKARFMEVATYKFLSFEASLDFVYGWIEQEGCHDSSCIFQGTAEECQEKLDQIQAAILAGESLFVIEKDGTRRPKEEASPRDESEVFELPF